MQISASFAASLRTVATEAAALAVPREQFVPEVMRAAAYVDRAVPLGDGRMLPAPLVQARMLVEARPQQSDRVLVVREGRVVHEGPAHEIDESRVLDLVMEGSAA